MNHIGELDQLRLLSPLSKLIEAALSGEEVVIARGRKPVVKLVPILQGKLKMGLLKRELAGPGPDFSSRWARTIWPNGKADEGEGE